MWFDVDEAQGVGGRVEFRFEGAGEGVLLQAADAVAGERDVAVRRQRGEVRVVVRRRRGVVVPRVNRDAYGIGVLVQVDVVRYVVVAERDRWVGVGEVQHVVGATYGELWCRDLVRDELDAAHVANLPGERDAVVVGFGVVVVVAAGAVDDDEFVFGALDGFLVLGRRNDVVRRHCGARVRVVIGHEPLARLGRRSDRRTRRRLRTPGRRPLHVGRGPRGARRGGGTGTVVPGTVPSTFALGRVRALGLLLVRVQEVAVVLGLNERRVAVRVHWEWWWSVGAEKGVVVRGREWGRGRGEEGGRG